MRESSKYIKFLSDIVDIFYVFSPIQASTIWLPKPENIPVSMTKIEDRSQT